jgi:uncharacterized protein (DUF433 family)
VPIGGFHSASDPEVLMAREVFPGITIDPQVVHERPVVAGTRVPVEVVVGELAGGSSFEDVMNDYHLTDEQIRAALAHAAQMLSSTIVYAAGWRTPLRRSFPGELPLTDEVILMRTIGRMRIVSLDEAPAVLEELRKRPPLSAEEIERRRRLSAEENRIVDEMEPLEEDVKDIVRRERGEEPIG